MKKLLTLMVMACVTVGAWADPTYVWSDTYHGTYLKCEITSGTDVTVTEIIFPDDVTEVYIPGTFTKNSTTYYVKQIGTGGNISTTGTYYNNAETKVTSLIIEEGVTTINSWALYKWNILTSVTLPSTLTGIGNNNFEKASSLATITVKGDWTSLWNDNVFGDVNKSTCKLIVPEGRKAYYDTTEESSNWSKTNNKFTNVVEAAKINITAAGYSTYYTSAGSYTVPDGLEAKTVTGVTADKLTFSDALTTVLKECAVLIKGDEGIYMAELNTSGDTFSGTNKLKGSDAAAETTGGDKYYLLANGSNGLGWYYGAENGAAFTNGAHKAYLALSNEEAAGARSFSLFDDDEPTGINAVKGERSRVNDVIYDLQGRRVAQPTKGLYIVNGKKVIIK